MIFNIIVCLIVLLISYHLYKKGVFYFVLLLPFFVQYLWMFFSILIIENNTYVNEQDRVGTFVYANFYLLGYFIVTIFSFIFFYQIFSRIFKINFPQFTFLKQNELKLVLYVCIVIVIIAYINFLSSPSAYNDDRISKFNYWDTAKFPFLKIVLGNTIGFLPFMFGLLFKEYKKTTIILLIAYAIYLIGLDQKFTAFLFGAISFFTSFFILSYKFGKINVLMVKKRYLIVVMALVFSLILFKYTKHNPFKFLNMTPIESVFYRAFGLQGHLFWGTSEKYIYNNSSNSWDVTELPFGMHVLMDDFTPDYRKKYLNAAWERGVSWTNAYPSVLNRIFPYPISLIIHFFLFAFIPFIYCLLVKVLRNKSLILSIIVYQLILWSINVYQMAYFFRMTKVLIILSFLFFIFHLFYVVKRRRGIIRS